MRARADLFDISVDNISVRRVLQSLADQAQVNLDFDPSIDGPISLNAYGQTLSEILERIARQLPIRFERIGETIVMVRDDFYIKQYSINYPDLARSYTSEFEGTADSAGGSSIGTTEIASSKLGTGSLWLDLEEAINNVLESVEIVFFEGGSGPVGQDEASQLENESVTRLAERVPLSTGTAFVHTLPDAGIVIVYGNSMHHQLASDIINTVTSTSRKQVLLQATVVEIILNNQYQQGIDWSVFNGANTHPKAIQSASTSYGRALLGPSLESVEEFQDFVSSFTDDEDEIQNLVRDFVEAPRFIPHTSASGGFFNASFTVGDLDFAVSLLDKFGDTRVVSSPRISALNGQGAILKVVTDQIYFTTEITRERDDAGVVTETIEVEEETVPVGFVVNVYPQIGDDGTIILSMRPSVSRVVGTAIQPSVGTNNAVGTAGVPILSVKEIETLMMLNNGQTAVMGGLIEDQLLDNNTSVPGLGGLPGIGNLFSNKNETTRRVEYVIFVSAKIIENPSIYGDYSEYLNLLPSDQTMRRDQTGTFLNRQVQQVPRAN